MLTRRSLIAGLSAAAVPLAPYEASAQTPGPAVQYGRPLGSQESFAAYIEGVKTEARRHGMSPSMLDTAFAGIQINAKVVDLDRHQPEFQFTWAQYRARIVSDARIARGRGLYAQNAPLIRNIADRYGVHPGVLVGIWGIESDFGRATGGFNVIEALTTLAWEGRRAAFFRSELMDALRILDRGDIAPDRMTGSYAGAMGQTQFMPDSFLKYAVDYTGDGRRDIWNDLGDVFASTANYLSREGWRDRLPWGVAVALPPSFDTAAAGRRVRRPVDAWARFGVSAANGRSLGPADMPASIILPGKTSDEAYLVYAPNYKAIWSYNPSDFYCVSVGVLGDSIIA
jgi:membrane-bound lytic murein transglycosylase B